MGNTVELIIRGKEDGSLINILKRSEAQIHAFGSKTIQVFGRAQNAIQGFGEKYLNVLSGLGIGIGLGIAAKDLMDFDGQLRKIQRTAGVTGQEAQSLRQDILALISPDTKMKMPITKGEWAAIAVELNATGIELKTIRDVMPQIGKGAVAGGVDKGLYAGTIGELLDKYKVAVKDLPALQEQLNQAMKFEDVRKNPAAFLQSIQNLSKAMQLLKATGMENVTPLLALQSQLTSFTGSPEEAGASLDALLRRMLAISKDAAKKAALKEHGIDFFNSKGALKNINELIPEIKKFGDEAKKFGGIDVESVKLFERPEAAKSIMMVVDKYDEVLKKQDLLKNSTGGLEKDFKLEADSMKAKLIDFQNQVDSFNTTHMTVALKYISSALDQLNKHPLIAKGMLAGAGVAVTAALGGKLISMGKGAYDFLKGKGGGALGSATGVQSVFVTNMPGAGTGIRAYGDDGLMGAGKPANTLNVLKKLFTTRGTEGLLGAGKGLQALKTGATIASVGLGTSAALVGLTAAGGYAVGTGINYALNKLIEKTTGEDKGLGGAIYDAGFEHKIKADRGKKIDELLAKVHEANMAGDKNNAKELLGEIQAVKNNINISVLVDKDGRPRIMSESNKDTSITVNRGQH